jgi:uncharacterized protein (DUF849 family)
VNRADEERVLNDYPDKVADALKEWKTAILDREQKEALTYFRLKANAGIEKVTERWLENKVREDKECYKARLDEIVKESEYTRLYEKLLSVKIVARVRTAF